MAEHLLLMCRHLGVVLDGERLLQRLQRVAVEDVVDAVYLLLPRHGCQVDVVDDPLRLAEHGVLRLYERVERLDLVVACLFRLHLEHKIDKVVAQQPIHPVGQCCLDDLLQFLWRHRLVCLRQDAQRVLGLIFQEVHSPPAVRLRRDQIDPVAVVLLGKGHGQDAPCVACPAGVPDMLPLVDMTTGQVVGVVLPVPHLHLFLTADDDALAGIPLGDVGPLGIHVSHHDDRRVRIQLPRTVRQLAQEVRDALRITTVLHDVAPEEGHGEHHHPVARPPRDRYHQVLIVDHPSSSLLLLLPGAVHMAPHLHSLSGQQRTGSLQPAG